MRFKTLLLILTAMTFSFSGLVAQEKSDTIIKKQKREKPEILKPYHWNVIKFNPTPMLLWGNTRNLTFSYERLVTKTMSVSLQVGYLVFPRVVNDTIKDLIAINSGKKQGINLALDYRYYPFSRNRRPAPDGLYIGTYLSYYGFRFENGINILHTNVDQSVGFTGRLNILNLGGMLGYQFIFWKRVSLDLLLFGPSVSYYSGELGISGDLDPDEIQIIDQELVDKLLERFPALGNLFSNEDLKFTGTKASLGIGFRYSIQLGFHF
jgi:hypothetical protein